MKLIKLSYSVIAYLLFIAVFNYLVLFLGAGFLKDWVPLLSELKTVDSGVVLYSIPSTPEWLSNSLLLLAFSVHHSVLARAGVKKLLTRFIPESAERSTFVLVTCLILTWMYMGWQPQPSRIWSVDGALAVALSLLFLAGAGLVLWSTFMINHWRLFGIAQAWDAFRGSNPKSEEFATPALYKYSRHPMYVGILIVLWATPTMTVGHLILACLWSVYVFIGIYFEERDLVREFGNKYLVYQEDVSKLLPFKLLGKISKLNVTTNAKLK